MYKVLLSTLALSSVGLAMPNGYDNHYALVSVSKPCTTTTTKAASYPVPTYPAAHPSPDHEYPNGRPPHGRPANYPHGGAPDGEYPHRQPPSQGEYPHGGRPHGEYPHSESPAHYPLTTTKIVQHNPVPTYAAQPKPTPGNHGYPHGQKPGHNTPSYPVSGKPHGQKPGHDTPSGHDTNRSRPSKPHQQHKETCDFTRGPLIHGKPVNKYNSLYWSDMTVYSPPSQSKKYASYSSAPGKLSATYPNSTVDVIDMTSFSYSCVDALSSSPVPKACVIVVKGYDGKGACVAKEEFVYKPKAGKGWEQKRGKFGGAYRGLKRVEFETKPLYGNKVGGTCISDVEYDVHEY
ncbi:hypothetical protein M501DRAFT_1018593 [Patellaria atrata CBS 101060]|uniref:Uncharacterized protein n=1 Tax=Patellaria atrata CBS 101060 TaxID=1346257 RepID=A0A9P4S5X5_9PEZI|nr:hypothetical protein M501DRAFT_1018593 [Patellaria atrata CBS 101060]